MAYNINTVIYYEVSNGFLFVFNEWSHLWCGTQVTLHCVHPLRCVANCNALPLNLHLIYIDLSVLLCV